MILYYVVFSEVKIPGVAVSVIAVTLIFAAAVFNMLKAGVTAVGTGQIEAAYSLGYTDSKEEQPKEAVNPRYAREPQKEKPAYIPTYQANKPQPVRTSDFTPETIRKGMQVVHPRFGEGIVVSCEPVAGDALVCVDFDGMKKKMLLNHKHKLINSKKLLIIILRIKIKLIIIIIL